MFCHKLSSFFSAVQMETNSCLQKPLTKAALLVISLLFAGGAVASFFSGLGIPGIVAFSGASGVSIVVFIIACLRSHPFKAQRKIFSQEINAKTNIVKKTEDQNKKKLGTQVNRISGNLSFGSSSSNKNLKSTRDASKLTKSKGEKPKTQVDNELVRQMILAHRMYDGESDSESDSESVHQMSDSELLRSMISLINASKTIEGATHQSTQSKENQLILADSELTCSMTPLINAQKTIKGATHQSIQSEENQLALILNELDSRIKYLFNTYAKEGESTVARELQSLFKEAQNSPDTFETLVVQVVNNSGYVPRFTAAVLEKLKWPDDTMKEKILPKCLGMKIARECISWEDGFINVDTAEEFNGFYTYRLTIMSKKIFGKGDFTKKPITMSDSLARAIGYSIRLSAENMIATLQKKKKQGEINKDTNIGIQVVIAQSVECRFPASMLSPMLPYLKNIPGLVGLELSDIGVRNPWDSEVINENNHGFQDQDAAALLAIFRTNPYLMQVQINVDGMNNTKQKEFMQQWQQIWKERSFQPPHIEQINKS